MAILNPSPRGALILACKVHGRPITVYYGDVPYIPYEAALRRINEFSTTHKRVYPACIETWIEGEISSG